MSYATILSPKKSLATYLASHAANALTKSVLAFGTPQHAAEISGLAQHFPGLQVIAACTDTVGFGIQRNGFSFAVFEEPIAVHDRIEGTGDAALRMTIRQFARHSDTVLPLANTMFHFDDQSALFMDQRNFKGLHIELPSQFKRVSGLKPIEQLSDTLTITSCHDNMLKTIDNAAAASFLEKAVPLIAPPTNQQQRAVFAEINSEFFKVTAGGGGLWSPRTRMLVLDTAAKPKAGDSIRFWLSETPMPASQHERLQSHYNEIEQLGGIVLESAPVQESLDEKPLSVGQSLGYYLPAFGGGSEQGFFVGDKRYSIAGETVWFN